MGLGKTLTMLTLISSFADRSKATLVPPPPSGIKAQHATFATLIVTPLSSESGNLPNLYFKKPDRF